MLFSRIRQRLVLSKCFDGTAGVSCRTALGRPTLHITPPHRCPDLLFTLNPTGSGLSSGASCNYSCYV